MTSKIFGLRAIIFFFLSLFVVIECSEDFSRYDSLLDEELEMPDFVKSAFFTDDAVELFNFNMSTSESVDCKDMNSLMSSGLKLLFANKVNINKTIKYRVQFSSRKQTKRVDIATHDKFDLDKTDFDIRRRTVVIVHGFLSGGSQSWIRKMEAALLQWDDVNVLVIDWSAIGKTINYYRAAMSTRIVGFEIARFLDRLVNATIAAAAPATPKWGKLHLIGHSLGSHISGVAAYDFQKMQKHWPVSRITGLDPALPCFNEVKNSFHLDSSDAQFVDVIHTSSSEKFTVGFGNLAPLGHVDFYPNGGKRQPGCSRVHGSIFDFLWVPATPVLQGTCSHGRSYEYFTESLVHVAKGGCKFWAQPWDRSYDGAMKVVTQTCNASNCTEMGIRAELYPHRGSFFLATSKKSPYCVTSKKDIEDIKLQLETEHFDEIVE